MTLRTVTGADAPFDPLRGRTVAVLGFGNQGAAHAMNLRDSGARVVVANRPDSERGRAAAEHGFAPTSIEEAVAAADLVIVGLPDEAQAEVWTERIASHLRDGAVVGFLHGFSLHYGLITPPPGTGVVLLAPKGPGATLRARFERGEGIPCLFAVHQPGAPPPGAPTAEAIGLAWAAGIGCARAAIVPTTVADETETDLFGEQAVLCGGMTELILAAFETLVEAGYPPELAYTECCHEVKQVADLVYERGLAGMMEAISNTAEYGALTAGREIVDEGVRGRMRAVLERVRNGTFAESLREDYRRGFPSLGAGRAALRAHPIEETGRTVRAWMPWLGATDRSETAANPRPQ
ncbi:MAG: ketol-acid reductoisomerase [Planctomycetes bacterium]|nr:ketol-acid reductoisomerase [Planctomycetota bacterium]